MLILDVKGELASISQDQTPDKKFCYYWNPIGLHDLPQNQVNPVGFLTKDSPTLVSDMKVFVEAAIPRSGSGNAAYFELNARRFAEAIGLGLVQMNGVLTLPDFYYAITALPLADDHWLDVAWAMHNAPYRECVLVEAEIAQAREDSSGGFQGIIGELQKSVAGLSDPLLLKSVSPPFDFDLNDLCSAKRAIQFYMMAPPEMISPWSLVIKSLFTGAMILKSRKPQARAQTWILDECAQLSGFELVEKMFTYGAGAGIRPVAVFQQINQMDSLSKNALRIITASAAVQNYFGVRDWESAKRISDISGIETLDYIDLGHQSRLRAQSRDLLKHVIDGSDPFAAASQLDQLTYEMDLVVKQRRPLITGDEVLNMDERLQLIFTDKVQGMICSERGSYMEQRFMAGRYHPNPYHPPNDKVRVMTLLGPRWWPVIVEKVPRRFAHYPQYQSGEWSRIRRWG